MKRIIFEFFGGCMDGHTIQGGGPRSLSTFRRDPTLPYWFATKCGTPGQKISMQDDAEPEEQVYLVTDRIECDEQVIVQVRHIPTQTAITQEACTPPS
jgi:hypothetical protein